jgi:hypothetical protein
MNQWKRVLSFIEALAKADLGLLHNGQYGVVESGPPSLIPPTALSSGGTMVFAGIGVPVTTAPGTALGRPVC